MNGVTVKWFVWWEHTECRMDWQLVPAQQRADQAEHRADALYAQFRETLRKQMNGWRDAHS